VIGSRIVAGIGSVALSLTLAAGGTALASTSRPLTPAATARPSTEVPLIALVLAAGFGYLRWKGQPLPWIGSGANKPLAAAQNSGAADASSPVPPSPAASPAGSAGQPVAGAAPSATDAAAASPSSASPTSAGPSSSSSTPPAAGPAVDASGGGTTSASAQPSTSNSGATAPSTVPAATMKPKPAPVMKPSALAPPQAADPVAVAQKYIYGKRVRQDCDRGLRILKPAADQANAKAMIEMGALYSAGLCTPRDLPTAYRWFALALRKDPTNQALNADLEKLWGEMTQPERELAIKLTQ